MQGINVWFGKKRLLLLFLLILGAGCHRREAQTAETKPASAVLREPGIEVHFEEISEAAGIHFTHTNGASSKKFMPETVGSGIAFLDYDNDGWQDLLIVNSTHWPDSKAAPTTSHLYHNNRNGTFTDVTQEAGLGFEMYGMGVAVGDYDNDGYEDIYLTGIGPNHLLRNTLGDPGRSGKIFQDMTSAAGVAGIPTPGVEARWKWSASAAWLDYDCDGRLDLFVTQYVKWSPKIDAPCEHHGIRGYCPPDQFEGTHCTLYHNEGGGKFRDVSKETGILDTPIGKSFGIAVADYNHDGFPDIVVSNDTWANFLFLNQGGKRFIEKGIEAGIAYGENGHPKAGMGIDIGDWRNNGHLAILIGNFANESLSLHEEEADLMYSDHAHTSGLAAPSLLYLTFGLFFFDYDLDGWQDIFTANGHVDDVVSSYNSMLSFKERPLLFHNTQSGNFEEAGKRSGLTDQVVGRGTAFADIDNDGDLDIALTDNGGRFRLYRNVGGNKHHWIRFRVQGQTVNRDGIGSEIRVTQGGITQFQTVKSGGSFLSENQRELTFGLGNATEIQKGEIVWPGGKREILPSLKADQQYLIREGAGVVPDPRMQPIH